MKNNPPVLKGLIFARYKSFAEYLQLESDETLEISNAYVLVPILRAELRKILVCTRSNRILCDLASDF